MTSIALSTRAVNQKVRTLHLPVLNWSMVYGGMIVALAVMLVMYVVLINNLTRGSYLIKSYNKEVDTLTTQNKNLQTAFAESGFLGNVQDRVRLLSFEKTTNITYVQMLDSSLSMVK